ncbi:Hypothetical protein I5071_62180 [Sandaracinus amylolyticus]|nr:Hypothetical protein I5071_62180 [Sandaracinus amylolyticus]
MWIVVAVELVAFAIVLVLIALVRIQQPDVFRAGQDALSPASGLALTLALVTSGWLTAEAVHAHREGALGRARRLYGGAVVTGLVFVALKSADTITKIGAGHGLGVDDFWDAYLLGTGFHFAHVIVGLGMLAWVGARVGRTRFEDPETAVAGTALFWHMCDVAWFFLFPLFFARS